MVKFLEQNLHASFSQTVTERHRSASELRAEWARCCGNRLPPVARWWRTSGALLFRHFFPVPNMTRRCSEHCNACRHMAPRSLGRMWGAQIFLPDRATPPDTLWTLPICVADVRVQGSKCAGAQSERVQLSCSVTWGRIKPGQNNVWKCNKHCKIGKNTHMLCSISHYFQS